MIHILQIFPSSNLLYHFHFEFLSKWSWSFWCLYKCCLPCQVRKTIIRPSEIHFSLSWLESNINKFHLIFLVSEAFLNCYQCDNDWEDDDCWKEDSGNYGRKIECGPEYDACAKSYGGKQKICSPSYFLAISYPKKTLIFIFLCFIFKW